MRAARRALWPCPRCGAQFTTRHQQHSCGRFELAPLFKASDPGVRRLYDRFIERVRACGDVTVIPQKTRVAVQARMRFAALTPRKRTLDGHLIMRTRHENPCFSRIEAFGPRCFRHAFRISTDRELAQIARWIPRAYRAGTQED